MSYDNSEILVKIHSLIEARIRPALQKDSGDIDIISFENGILKVSLIGNCYDCPYATVTLKDGVEKILKQYIPEVKAVINEK